MTDVLIRDEPHDTGDIPRVGEATERLNQYLSTAPFPTIRRSHMDVTGEVVAYRPAEFAHLDAPAGLGRPGQPAPPRPLPAPGPPPKPSSVWKDEPAPAYVGRHRRPSRWDWLTVPLAMGWQRIVGAM